jgi:hypothetical protein
MKRPAATTWWRTRPHGETKQRGQCRKWRPAAARKGRGARCAEAAIVLAPGRAGAGRRLTAARLRCSSSRHGTFAAHGAPPLRLVSRSLPGRARAGAGAGLQARLRQVHAADRRARHLRHRRLCAGRHGAVPGVPLPALTRAAEARPRAPSCTTSTRSACWGPRSRRAQTRCSSIATVCSGICALPGAAWTRRPSGADGRRGAGQRPQSARATAEVAATHAGSRAMRSRSLSGYTLTVASRASGSAPMASKRPRLPS